MGWVPEYAKNNVGRIIAGVDFTTSAFENTQYFNIQTTWSCRYM
ncbi:hypothetical protein VC87395_000940 [Vibrio paracholerae 87395]|nr:hypothetical protein VC87395_000940 [Vibrio paracholerae 87395]